MSDEQKTQIDKLSRALAVSNSTIQMLEKKLNTCQMVISGMERDKRSWEEMKVMQERIISQQLAAADEEKRKLQDEIIELRAKLKAA